MSLSADILVYVASGWCLWFISK